MATTSMISFNFYQVPIHGAGPLFCATLCCSVAIWVLSELRHYPNPQIHISQQRTLISSLAIGNLFLAIMVRLGPLSMIVKNKSRQAHHYHHKNKRHESNETNDHFTEIFVGNGATVVGWVAAVYYTYLVRETTPDSLRSLLIELPLSFILTLLRDDGGILLGLDVNNRFTVPYLVCILKLGFMPFYSLLLRGAPFLVTASFAESVKQTAAPMLKGVDVVRVTRARALRELSFWTASSLNTPTLELVLLMATIPVHLTLVHYLWNKRQIFSSSSILLFLPLNLIALVVSKQLGTQLLGLLGLGLGLWQITDSRGLSRALQRRL
jgi:hypothetical protein